MLYKTLIVPLKCSKSDREYLHNCNKLSAQVWNLCIQLDKENKSRTNKYLDRNELQKLTKKCVPLHAKGIHHVAHKYLFARDAMFKSIKAGTKNVKLPYRNKRFFTTGWDGQSIRTDHKKGTVILPKPMILNENGKQSFQKPIQCYVKNIPQNIVEVELIHKESYYLAIKYKEEVELYKVNSSNSASIDLGEIHAITSIDSSGNAIIITGRKLREIKHLRNKQQARIYQRMSKCTKGSKQYRKYLKALRNLKSETDRKVNDAIHKISKLYLDYCLTNQISKVYYGDLDSATRNSKNKNKGSNFTRQKLSQWNYGLLMQQIDNKLKRYDIALEKVKEYYTSQKCPNCSKLNKVNSRQYKCAKCDYEQHRDIVGAINILNDNENTDIVHYTSKLYLQIA